MPILNAKWSWWETWINKQDVLKEKEKLYHLNKIKMSLDGRYILWYDSCCDTAKHRDKQLLLNNIKHLREEDFIELGWPNLCFSMPKHTLPEDIKEQLMAEQILERLEGRFWEDLTDTKHNE